MMGARRLVAVLVVTGVMPAAIAACSTEDDSDGFGVPTASFDETVDASAAPFEGTVTVRANGCFDLELPGGELRWIVWPEGTRLGDDGDELVVGDLPVSDGDAITATGALTGAEVLPGWENPDSYFASFGTFCGAQEYGVVVLDEVAVD